MLTTKRSYESNYSSQDGRSGAIDLLERRNVSTYKEYISPETEITESFEEAKARMQRNLDHIMNYERFSAENSSISVVEESIAEAEQEVVSEAVEPVLDIIEDASDEDLMPTTTTIQFGDGQIEQIYDDLNKQKRVESVSYHLNKKGKVILTLYALAVSVILALIVLNTGVLASLRGANTAKSQVLQQKVAQYNTINEEIDSISSNDYVIDKAVNDLGMIKK